MPGYTCTRCGRFLGEVLPTHCPNCDPDPAKLLRDLKAHIRSPETREILAAEAHDAWSGWMEYLFTKCIQNTDKSVTIPKSMVDRWKRQLDTPYAKLSEQEKDSDRKEADRYLKIINGAG